MGRIERLRRLNQIAPQASRQCSRLGSSTAVASLDCHGICSWRLVPRTPRHMPRQSSRSLGCAVAARRLLPLLPPKAAGSAAAADPSSRLKLLAGRASPRGGGGAAAPSKCWIKGCPILASLFERAEGWLFGRSMSCVIATRHEQPCPCTVAVRPRRKLLRAIHHRAASPNVSRSMFRVPAEPGILTSSGTRVATPGGHAPRQAVAALLCLSWNRARLPRARPPLLRRCGRAAKSVRSV